MQYVSPIVLFFILVTFSQALFLIYIKNLKNESNTHRLKFWKIHYAFNGILWLLLLSWIIVFQFYSKRANFSPLLQISGIVLFLIGLYFSIRSIKQLGLTQAMGYRFFKNEKTKWYSSEIYSALHNPMYDGFILVFLGLALTFGIIGDFFLALASFLLLNVFLATIEKEKSELKLNEIF